MPTSDELEEVALVALRDAVRHFEEENVEAFQVRTLQALAAVERAEGGGAA